MLLRAAFVTLAFGAVGDHAHARSLQVGGAAGYLSEWEISATVSDRQSDADGALSGPLTLKHTGVCAVAGPVEKIGEMKIKVSASVLFPRSTSACASRGHNACIGAAFPTE